jgi:hypothetical protein
MNQSERPHITFTESYDLNTNYFDIQYMHTRGDEFLTPSGTLYAGYYHIHYSSDGNRYYMEGPQHIDDSHGILTRI